MQRRHHAIRPACGLAAPSSRDALCIAGFAANAPRVMRSPNPRNNTNS